MKMVYIGYALDSEIKIYSRLIYLRYLFLFVAYNIKIVKDDNKLTEK